MWGGGAKVRKSSFCSHHSEDWLGQEILADAKSQGPDLMRSSIYAAGSQHVCP